MGKKKRTKKGWLCPECKTVYAPRVKQCKCVAVRQVELKDVEITGEYQPYTGLVMDWARPIGLSISSTDWSKGIAWYRMPPRDPNEPVSIYPNVDAVRERDN